jgi:hypothetical protein
LPKCLRSPRAVSFNAFKKLLEKDTILVLLLRPVRKMCLMILAATLKGKGFASDTEVWFAMYKYNARVP